MTAYGIELTRDVVSGFLNRYAHRVTDNFQIQVRCHDGDLSLYCSEHNLIVVGDVGDEIIDFIKAKATTLHECGHALFTPSSLMGTLRRMGPMKRLLWNLLEDGRIELCLMNSVPRAIELLTYMNELEFRENAEDCKSTPEILWRGLWELAKLGELRSEPSAPDDGILNTDEIAEILRKARPIIAEARYSRDPWRLPGLVAKLWGLVSEVFSSVELCWTVAPPQVFSRGDSGKTPKVTRDIGGGAVPGGRHVAIAEPDHDALISEAQRERERLERDARGRLEVRSHSISHLRTAASASLEDYRKDSVCGTFRGTVRIHNLRGDPEEYRRLRCQVAPVTKKLSRALAGLARMEALEDVRRGLAAGTVDPPLAYRFFLGDREVFRRNTNPLIQWPAVMLLVDESGSMGDCDRYLHARKAAVAVHEAFLLVGVNHAITGFTTEHDGSRHHIYPYVLFGEGLRKSHSPRLAGICARDCNRDGLALKIAGDYLCRQKQARKLLVVISDGLPNTRDYGGELAVSDSRRAVRELERRGVNVVCLYIGPVQQNFVPRIYERYAFVGNLSDLPGYLSKTVRDFAGKAIAS